MKFKTTIGAIFLILVLMLCTYNFLTKRVEVQYKSTVSVKECGDNYQKASEILMERYLSHYRSPFVGVSNLLTDYKIIKINASTDTTGSESLSNQNDKYRFTVIYSVRMFTENDWRAGNGTTGKDGWINEKYGFGYFHRDGDRFILDGIGTGP